MRFGNADSSVSSGTAGPLGRLCLPKLSVVSAEARRGGVASLWLVAEVDVSATMTLPTHAGNDCRRRGCANEVSLVGGWAVEKTLYIVGQAL